MRVPVVLLGEGLVDAVVEVFVVREDDVAADIVELVSSVSYFTSYEEQMRKLTKPSGVMSVEARPPGVGLLSMINHDASF